MKHPHGFTTFDLLFHGWKRNEKDGSNPRNARHYWGFPVCRYYTVRAHVCHDSPPDRYRRENGIFHAGSLFRRLHSEHLHPRHHQDAGGSRQPHGQLHGTESVKNQKTKRQHRPDFPKESTRCCLLLSPYGPAAGRRFFSSAQSCLKMLKRPENHTFSGRPGAGGVTRTPDLLITKIGDVRRKGAL